MAVIDIRHKVSAHWRDEPARLDIIAEQAYNRSRTEDQPMWLELPKDQRDLWITKVQMEKYT